MFCAQGSDVRSTVCAIKELKGAHRDLRENFAHEVDILKKVSGRHPNIVRMLVWVIYVFIYNMKNFVRVGKI